MKKCKNIFLALLFSFTAVLLSACTNNINPSLEFKDEVISLVPGQEYNIENNISLKNIALNDISFSSGNSRVCYIENNIIKASSYGTTNIIAKYKDGTLAAATVKVLGTLAAPLGLNFDGENLKWDKVYAEDSDGVFFSRSYEIVLKKDDEAERTIISNTNYYKISEEGTYTVKIKSLGEGRIQDSEYSETFTFAYGKMGEFTSISYDSNTGILSWSNVENAKYRVKLNGLLYPETTTNSMALELSKAGTYEVSVIAYDNVTGTRVPSESEKLSLIKLQAPELMIKKEQNSAVLEWKSDLDRNFKVSYEGSTTGEFITKKKTTYLENLPSGTYNVTVTSIGNGNELSSNKSNAVLVNKLPTADISFVNSYKTNGSEFIAVNISSILQDEYVYKTTITSPSGKTKTSYYSISGSMQADIDMVGLTDEVGKFIITTQIVAKNPIDINGNISSSIEVIRHEKVSNLTNFVEDGNLFVTFDKVTYADSYKFKINDATIEATVHSEDENVITYKLGNIDAIVSANSFTLTVIATSTASCIESEVTKNISKLGYPADLTLNGNTFTFSAVDHASGYKYEIYKYNKDYSDEGTRVVVENIIEPNFNIDLSFGYYEARVYTLGDNNNYLSSLNFASKRFTVSTKLQTPNASLTKIDGEYKLTIEKVENASKYRIELDGGLLQEQTGLEYVFVSDFSDVKDYQIKVIAISDDPVILPSSDELILTLTRLAPFSEYIVENDVLKITKPDNVKEIKALVVGDSQATTVLDNLELDLKNYFGNFTVQVQFIGIDTVLNHYYLESSLKNIEFSRMLAPTEFSFANNVLTFKNNQICQDYKLTITVTTSNGTITQSVILGQNKDVEYSVVQNGGISEYSVDFNKVIEFANINSAFSSAYANRKQVKLELFALKEGLENSVYYLTSYQAKSKENLDYVLLDTMQTVDVSFDVLTNMLNFGNYIPGTQFNIYVKDNLGDVGNVITTSEQSYFIGDLMPDGGSKYFEVIATHPSQIDSKRSKYVLIKRIASSQSITVNETSFSYIVPEDSGLDHVEINGINNNKSNKYNYSSMTEYVIEFFAKATASNDLDGNKTYYMNSLKSTFTIQDMIDSESGQIADRKISWQKPALDNWNNGLATEAPLKYVLKIYKDSELIKESSKLQTNEFSLSNVFFEELDAGVYNFEVYATLSNYSLIKDGRGYKGTCKVYSGQITKESTMENVSLAQSIPENILEELNKDIILSFNGNYSADIKFNVYINNTLVETTFSLLENKYSIVLTTYKELLLNDFEIKVEAYTLTTIVSSKASIQGNRNVKPVDITLSNDRVLTITNNPIAKYGYIVEVTASVGTTNFFVNSSSVDLTTLLTGAVNNVTIKVLTKGDGINDLSALYVFEKSFNILNKPVITKQKDGITVSSVDEGAQFYLTITKGLDIIVEDYLISNNTYIYPNSLLGQYELKVRSKKQDNITSEYASTSVDITRLDKVNILTFSRDVAIKDKLTFSWGEVNNATYYIWGLKNLDTNTMLIENKQVLTNSVDFWQEINNEAITLQAGVNYAITIIAGTDVAAESLNSNEASFSFTMLDNTVQNITLIGNNKVQFEDLSVGKYLVKYKNGNGEETTYIEVSGTSPIVVNLNVANLTRVVVEIIKLGNITSSGINNGAIVDGIAVKKDIFKLEDITVSIDEYGYGKIEHQPIDGEISFYAKELGDFVKVDTFEENGNVKFRVVDLANKLGITTAGQKTITFESRALNYISSDQVQVILNLTDFSSDISKYKSELYENDFLIWTDESAISKLYEIEIFEANVLKAKITMRESDLNEIEGKKAFNVTKILNSSEYNIAAGEYDVKVRASFNQDGVSNVSFFSKVFKYNKLRTVGEVKVLESGEISWTETNPDASGYIVYFIKKTNPKEVYKYYVASSNITKFDATSELGASTDAYYCCVRAVSDNLARSSSDAVYILNGNGENKIVYKVKAPEKLTLDDNGMLGFVTDNFDLAVGDPSQMIGKILSKPFSFTFNNFESIMVTLKFVGEINTYKMTLPAYKLIRVSEGLFATLQGLTQTIPDLSQIVNQLMENRNGIFNNEVFFDDYGEQIPAGEYKVFIMQKSFTNIHDENSDVWLNSAYNSEYVSLYVSASPELLTYSEVIDGENIYYLTFNEVEIKTAAGENPTYALAESYVLHFDKNNIFNIVKNGDNWQLSKLNQESGTPINLTVRNGRVYIKLSLAEDGLYDLLTASDSFSNVQLYAKGNSLTANGKTTVVSVKKLSIPSVGIFEGKFKLARIDNVERTRITYKYTSSTSTKEVLNYGGSKESWAMEELDAGTYYAVTFQYLGSQLPYSVTIDGPVAQIGTVCKLIEPDVKTEFGDFLLSDRNAGGVSKYRIANNVSDEILKITKKVDDKTLYEVGTLDGDQIAETATKFMFVSQGTEDVSKIEEPTNNDVRFYINSKEAAINAYTLSRITDYKIDKFGQVVWSPVTGKGNVSIVDEEIKVFYKLLITNYKQTNTSAGEALTPYQDFVFYTEKTSYDFSNIILDGVFDIEIQAVLVREKSGETSSTVLTTIEGKEIISDNLQNNSSYILKSFRKSAKNLVRLLNVEDFKIEEGMLKWANNDINQSNASYELQFINQSDIRKDIVSELKWWENGITLEEKTAYEAKIYSIPKAEVDLEADGINNKFIRSRGVSYLAADGTTDTVSKLPIMKSNNVKVSTESGYQAVSWESYKNDATVSDDSKYNYQFKYSFDAGNTDYKEVVYNGIKVPYLKGYNIFVNGILETEMGKIDVVGSTESGYTLNVKLGSKVINNKVQVIPKSDYYGKLKSSAYEFSMQAPNGLDESVKITYNNTTHRFEWDAVVDPNILYVITTYKVVGETKTPTRIYTTSQPYFEPVVMNETMTISVSLRYGSSAANSNLDSQEKFAESNVYMNMFNAGAGTENNPYIINTVSQLNNIRHRQMKSEYLNKYVDFATKQEIIEESNKFHFRQNANLEKTSDYFNFDFAGVYDGNGMLFTYNPSQLYTINIAGGESYENIESTTYTKYSALFRSNSGTIKNLNFKFTPRGSASSNNVMLAGLAVTNTGTIDNCKIVSTSNYNAVTSYMSLLVGGFAAINKGNIINSVNEYGYDINVASTQKKITYGAIATINEGINAIINGSVNKGNITINTNSTSNNFYIGGISYKNNGGAVLKCVNEGNISRSSSNISSSTAGIVFDVTGGGKVVLSANVAEIQGSQSAGVVYRLQGAGSRLDYSVGTGDVNGLNTYALIVSVLNNAAGIGNYSLNIPQSANGVGATSYSHGSDFTVSGSYEGVDYRINMIYNTSSTRYSVSFS